MGSIGLRAALSIDFIFTVSSTIVHGAAVVLEHTGIPRSIALLQVLSALSGAGFTTSESELLGKTPERRRALTYVIIAGSLGIASLAGTIIVGALGVSDTNGGRLLQLAAIAMALVYVRYILFSPRVDTLICGSAGH